jgi:hypothetical protein
MESARPRKVRMERVPHREAVQRVEKVYQMLRKAGEISQLAVVQEVRDEQGSGVVCPGVDFTAGAGSDD